MKPEDQAHKHYIYFDLRLYQEKQESVISRVGRHKDINAHLPSATSAVPPCPKIGIGAGCRTTGETYPPNLL